MRINLYFSKGKYDQSENLTGSSIKPPKDTASVFLLATKPSELSCLFRPQFQNFRTSAAQLEKSIFIFAFFHQRLIYITVRFSRFIVRAQTGEPGANLRPPHSSWGRREQPNICVKTE